jgi:DNA-binding NtrC family response regulator
MTLASATDTALILAPHGRDAALLQNLLSEAGIGTQPVNGLRELVAALDDDTAFVVLAEEALRNADPRGLSDWLNRQAEWSDLPFIMLTSRGGGLERNPTAARYLELIGNVTFLERPFHSTTLVSLARAARRGRRRQWEARARLEATHRASVALGESEGMLREAQELAGIGSWRFDHETGVGRVSQSYRALHFLSTDSNQLALNELLNVIHPDDRAHFITVAQRGLETGERTVVEYRVTAPDGSVRWIRGVGHTSDTARPATTSSGM